VGGTRAYTRARRGEQVELPERTIHVYAFELLERTGELARFRIACSSGTYVRALIADLGDAYCLELRRTAIGPFRVEGAWDGDGEPAVLGLGEAMSRVMPAIRLSDDDARAAAHGRGVRVAAPSSPVLLLDAAGPVAVAELRDGGELRPVVGFRG
jgi:tRNA pseudouridine55 synthase